MWPTRGLSRVVSSEVPNIVGQSLRGPIIHRALLTRPMSACKQLGLRWFKSSTAVDRKRRPPHPRKTVCSLESSVQTALSSLHSQEAVQPMESQHIQGPPPRCPLPHGAKECPQLRSQKSHRSDPGAPVRKCPPTECHRRVRSRAILTSTYHHIQLWLCLVDHCGLGGGAHGWCSQPTQTQRLPLPSARPRMPSQCLPTNPSVRRDWRLSRAWTAGLAANTCQGNVAWATTAAWASLWKEFGFSSAVL